MLSLHLIYPIGLGIHKQEPWLSRISFSHCTEPINFSINVLGGDIKRFGGY